MTARAWPPPFPPADVFIETGFGQGETVAAVATLDDYQTIYSLELDPQLVEAGRTRFAGDARVTIYCGESSNLLRTVCDPNRTTVFWLDAHYSAGMFCGGHERERALQGERECPLLDELATIMAVPWVQRPIIFIDDASLFGDWAHAQSPTITASGHRVQWPTVAEISAALPTYTVTADETIRYLYCEPHAASS